MRIHAHKLIFIVGYLLTFLHFFTFNFVAFDIFAFDFFAFAKS